MDCGRGTSSGCFYLEDSGWRMEDVVSIDQRTGLRTVGKLRVSQKRKSSDGLVYGDRFTLLHYSIGWKWKSEADASARGNIRPPFLLSKGRPTEPKLRPPHATTSTGRQFAAELSVFLFTHNQH